MANNQKTAKNVASLDQVRNLFLQSALRCSQTLPVQNYAAGQTLQFELNNSGILRYLQVEVDGILTVTVGTGTAAVSQKGPYVLFPNVQFVDYLGTTRVNAGAYLLQTRVDMNKYGYDPSFTPIDPGVKALFYNYATADGAQALKFGYTIPMMYDENDPRGGIISTVPNGKCYLKLTPITGNLYGANDDSLVVVTGNATATLTGTITVTQYYFNPQTVKIGGQEVLPIPYSDFQWVHELLETQTTSNLAANMNKTWNLPTGRLYQVLLQHYFNGATGPVTADIDRIAFLYDGNTPTLDETQMAYLHRTRNVYGRDLPKGLFAYDFRKRPWDSNVWGQLQTLIHIASGSTVNAGAYLSVLSDTLYLSTANLSGLSQ